MPLTPDHERELDAVAAELTATDTALARALTGAPPTGPRSIPAVLLAQRVNDAVSDAARPHYPIDPDDPDWERRAGEHLAEEQGQVEAAMAGSRCTWTYHAAHGDPVGLLRRVADAHDALLFVVGTRRGCRRGGEPVAGSAVGLPRAHHPQPPACRRLPREIEKSVRREQDR